MSAKAIKPSQRSKADFEFFAETELDMIGHAVGIGDFRESCEGYSALECWYQRDTHGQALPCREIGLLQKAERGKQSWNLQVKMWAETMNDPMCLHQPELVDYCHGLPEWIFEATIRQAGKMHLQQQGWIPRFLRLERVHGQWWPPHCDRFDPSI